MKLMGLRCGVVGVVCAMALISSVTQAVIINVPGDQPTIQAGIDAAINGDQVVVASGTYRELINFLGKAITVRSSDGPDVTIINGDIDDNGTGDGTVVSCITSETALTVLDGFMITRGEAASGGGMLNNPGSPTVTNCIFRSNTSTGENPEGGGGMANIGATSNSTVTNCRFELNSAFNRGGGMYNNESSPAVTGCNFSNNSAGAGGGMFNNDCFANNSAPTVTNCTFSDNAAGSGGGMWNRNTASPTVTNCIFSRNTASNVGGGMRNDASGDPTVANCTFSKNAATAAGGAISSQGSLGTFANCIIWANTSPGVDEIDGTPTVTYSDVSGGFEGMGNININPLFIDFVNQDYHISPGSPCIDAADNTAVPPDEADLDGDFDTAEPTPFDLDGNPRFVDDRNSPDCPQEPDTCGDPPIVDMGAYEFGGAPPPSPCPTDLNGDGETGIVDFLELLANWGPCP